VNAVVLLARGILMPAVAGAVAVLGFAPFYAWPVPIISLAMLFHVWEKSGSPVQAAISGFVFGLGLFLTGVSWVFVSLHVFGDMQLVLAAIATFLFCSVLAAFPAAAGWLVARFGQDPATRVLLLAPTAFVLLEWTRSWIFTGFPWLAMGWSQVPGSPLAGFAPIVGTYGVSLAMAACAGIAASLLRSAPWSRNRYALLTGVIALFAIGAGLKLVPWTQPTGESITMALVQGNIPQQLKWRDEVRMKTYADYRKAVIESDAQVVVLPETALPAFFDQLPAGYIDEIREHARAKNKEVFIGVVERLDTGSRLEYYNSVVSVGAGPPRSYRKRHLVPFGEFIPTGFGWVLSVLKIPLTDFGRGDAKQGTIPAAGITFAVAICYEDVFGEEMIAQLPDARVLVNVSNDAWFGESLAAEQHLQASQMRALETGRWMVRSTNTGVTAAIDARGRVVSRLPAFTQATLNVSVEPRSGATPYVRWGNYPALALLVAGFAFGVMRRVPR
jgi:apolipoprotein N-acyltransferase